MHDCIAEGRSSLLQPFPLLRWFHCHCYCCHLEAGMADIAPLESAKAYGSLHAGFIRDYYQNAHTLPTQPNCQKKLAPRSQSADNLSYHGNRQSSLEPPHHQSRRHDSHSVVDQQLGEAIETGCQGNDIFPFHKLPTDCKLKVFLCLDVVSRGRAARVCREWNQLMMSSTLWSDLDFSTFPLCFNRQPNHVCSKVCYVAYRSRVKHFINYLTEIKPALKHLCFKYDIEEYEDGWLPEMDKLLAASYCRDLESAHLSWKDTPIKPFWIEHGSHSLNNCNDFMYKHRHRHRTFVNFLENLIGKAPNLHTLHMQFGWSMRSICNLSLLRNLHTLVLDKYFVFQPLTQACVDQLFKCTPKLRTLVMEVWTPSGQGLVKFRLNSASLRYLDLSRCRGFYLEGVDLPNLQSFHFQRHPWNGPLLAADSITFPCLHHLLAEGAPSLRTINTHVLEDDWQTNMTHKFGEVLRGICVCRVHKKGWMM